MTTPTPFEGSELLLVNDMTRKPAGIRNAYGDTLFAGGVGRNKRILSRGLTGDVTTQATTDANFVSGVTAGGLSTMTRVGLATEFDAVRILIANYDTNPQSVTSVLFAVPDASGVGRASGVPNASLLRGAGGFTSGNAPSTNGDNGRDMIYGQAGYMSSVNSPTRNFMPVTFDGSATLGKTLPPRLGTGLNVASWTPTDWMPVASLARQDGGTIPLLDVFISWAVGAVVTLHAFGTDQPSAYARMGNDAVYPKMWRTHFLGGQVTNIASFGSIQRVQSKTPAFIVQYRSRKDAVQVMMLGDSIYEGISQTMPHTNFFVQAAEALSTPDLPIEVLPFARLSQHSEEQLNHARQVLSYVQPSIVVAQSLSTNRMNRDNEQALKNSARASVGNVLNETQKYGAVPVVVGITPTTTAAVNYGTADAWRISANAELSQMLPREGGVFVDLDSTLGTGGVVGGQLQLGAEMSSDGIHLIDYGHTAAKQPVQAGIAQALGML